MVFINYTKTGRSGEPEILAILYNNEYEEGIKCRPYNPVKGEELEHTIQKLHDNGYEDIDKVLGDGEGNYLAEIKSTDGHNYQVFISKDEFVTEMDELTKSITLESLNQLRQKRDEAIQRVGDISDVELKIFLFNEQKKAKRYMEEIDNNKSSRDLSQENLQKKQELYTKCLSNISDLKLVAKYRKNRAKREKKTKKDKIVVTPDQIYSFIERIRGYTRYEDNDSNNWGTDNISDYEDFPTN